MGTTESLPVEANSDPSSSQHDVDSKEDTTTVAKKAESIIAKQSHASQVGGNQPRPDEETEKVPPDKVKAPTNSGDDKDPSVKLNSDNNVDKPIIMKTEKSSNAVVEVGPEEEIEHKIKRKPAQRKLAISDIFKEVENFKMVVNISDIKVKKTLSSKDKKKKNGSKKNGKENKKRKAELSSSSSSNEKKSLPPKRTKRASKPSARKMEAEEEEEDADYSEVSRNADRNKQKKAKSKEDTPVLHHVLFSTDPPEPVTSSKNKKRKKDETSSMKATLETESNAGVEIIADTAGPPRTKDQNAKIVKNPHVHDILMGRGNGVAQFPGNQVFRGFCWQVRDSYHKALRNEKGKVAERVIKQVKSRNPPGRFLERQGSGHYTEVPHDRVKEKICQALREKKWMPSGKIVIIQSEDTPKAKKKKSASSKKSTTVSNTSCASQSSVPQTALPKSISAEITAVEDLKVKVNVTDASKNESPTKTKANDKVKTVHPTSTILSKPESEPEPVPIPPKEKQGDHPLHLVNGKGSRVSVYWPLDDKYYDATVEHRVENYVYLTYDDDETEWLDISKNKFKVLVPATKAPSPKKTKKASSKVKAKIAKRALPVKAKKPKKATSSVKHLSHRQLPVTLKQSKQTLSKRSLPFTTKAAPPSQPSLEIQTPMPQVKKAPAKFPEGLTSGSPNDTTPTLSQEGL